HGLDDLAHEAVDARRPFLGICIGMQLLFEASEEAPGVAGLGILPGTVRLLPGEVKRPQMQWNVLDRRGDPDLLRDVPDPAWAYFVHSYAADTDEAIVTATCDYGGPVVASVERGSVWATQFHPEKSSRTGLAVLRAFIDRCAAPVAA
ncbi:MAG: imidazole glycerol phosphate synthase subunit HisH, partial [Acidimicrobiales bacterium]